MSVAIIQYNDPYTIQTSDATIRIDSIESVSIEIERASLKDYERQAVHNV